MNTESQAAVAETPTVWSLPSDMQTALKSYYANPELIELIAREGNEDHDDVLTLPGIPPAPTVMGTRSNAKRTWRNAIAREKRLAQQTAADDVATSEIFEAFSNEHPTHTLYVKFALAMLVTCCEDLVAAKRVLDDSGSSALERRRAAQSRLFTSAWLCDCDSPFTFEQCTELLESEIQVRSMEQVVIPRVAERRDELANWIMSDPAQALAMLEGYAQIFAPDMIFDNSRSKDDEETTPVDRRRKTVPRG